MKKVTILGLILLGLGFSPLLVRADIIPDNTHKFERCVKIVNLNEFPNIILMGRSHINGTNNFNEYSIKNNECLEFGFKYEPLSIYWFTDNSFKVFSNSNLLLDKIETYGDRVKDTNHLIVETIEYSIIKSTSGEYRLQKTKLISEYNNRKSIKIETFGDTESKDNIKDLGNKTEPTKIPTKISFWQFIKCFFGLSKNC